MTPHWLEGPNSVTPTFWQRGTLLWYDRWGSEKKTSMNQRYQDGRWPVFTMRANLLQYDVTHFILFYVMFWDRVSQCFLDCNSAYRPSGLKLTEIDLSSIPSTHVVEGEKRFPVSCPVPPASTPHIQQSITQST